jgi:hypothetical protein
MDPGDPRWQLNHFDQLLARFHTEGAEGSLRISRWFDPPLISPRQEAVALPLSVAGMISAYAVVSVHLLPASPRSQSSLALGVPVPPSRALLLVSSRE